MGTRPSGSSALVCIGPTIPKHSTYDQGTEDLVTCWVSDWLFHRGFPCRICLLGRYTIALWPVAWEAWSILVTCSSMFLSRIFVETSDLKSRVVSITKRPHFENVSRPLS